MLQQPTKKKAITKYSKLLSDGKTNEEIAKLMDEEEFTTEEQAEIFAGISDAIESGKNKLTDDTKIFDPANPNAIIKNDIDYANLVGPEFKRYLDLLESLDPERGHGPHTGHCFQFELYRAKPIRKVRFEGMEGSPMDFIGIMLKTMGERDRFEPPIVTTSITIRTARELNSQIVNAHGIAGHGTYYLLKK
ncbi:hypothetical protein QWZ08_24980 [Ferruginibacter paludis]|uniref:hypothetical protein n=1 Tax=Ferruginibacter paludis TaxID=1310417 RepID=UPI0025B429D2|nr:hypothetical protein [Ferruginibacter paludis]MDN3658922.1 hypothetical protein [Ferruginibacter paludis]